MREEEIYSWVRDLPIIDWHNHLDVGAIAADRPFGSLYEVWVKADPYKHRAMRICGVPERLITGDAPEAEKMAAWEATLPKLVGNPIFAWSRLEMDFLRAHPLGTLTPQKILKAFNVEYASPCMTAEELGRRASCPSGAGACATGGTPIAPGELGRRASCPSGAGWTAAAVREFPCTCADTAGHCSPTLAAGSSHRRHYPHIGQDSTLVCVTFRLADSLSESQLAELEERKHEWPKAHPEPWDETTSNEWSQEVRDRIDKWLDAGHGSCILADERCRKVVEEALEFFDSNGHPGPTDVSSVGGGAVRDGQDARRPSETGPTDVSSVGRACYRLHSYVVMPNHVHVLFELFAGEDLPRIVQSWKSYTAKRLNELLGRSGNVWREEYFDRLIRNPEHYENVVRYIRKNGEAAKALARIHADGQDARRPCVTGPTDVSSVGGGAVRDGQDARRPGETRIVPSLRMNAGERIPEDVLGRFHAAGCRVVDISADDGELLDREFDSLSAVAGFAAAHGWTMLLHLGALRSTSDRLRQVAGPAGGYAGMRTPVDPAKVARFLNRLECDGQDARRPGGLPRTVLMTLNPEAHAQLAVLAGSFVEDGVPGKVQLGPAWWWCDHREGIFDVFEKCAAYGVLSTFIGMTTDSRSFLSFVRHDYFRRLLSRWVAQKVADGDFPDDAALLRPICENVCYRNAKGMIR